MIRTISINNLDHSKSSAVVIVEKDSKTECLHFAVDRFNGPIDFSDLQWKIYIRLPDQSIIQHDLEDVSITDSHIIIDWIITGDCTEQEGKALFQLSGYCDGKRWTSGLYSYAVKDTIST